MPQLSGDLNLAGREISVQLYAPHAAQWRIHQAMRKYRFVVADCGRRMGKTLAGDNELSKNALEEPGSVNWWVAPTVRQAEPPFEQAARALYSLLRKKPNETKMRLDLINGSRIEYRSADDPENLRGDGPSFVVIDECRKIKARAWKEVLRPSIVDHMGRVLFISTPNGRDWFEELFRMGQHKDYPEYWSIQLPSSANPFLSRAEIEEARRTLPDRVFRQEFLAEFIDDAGVFRGVRRCIRGKLQEPLADHTYVLGWDVAKHEDFSVMTVLDAASGQVVAFDRFNGVEYPLQLARLVLLAKKYNDAYVIMDSTGVGDPLFDMVRGLGLTVEGYYFTNLSKKEIVDGLSLAIEHQRVTFPNIPELIDELEAFAYKITESRNVVYSAPEGHHDDCVFSLALAVHGAHLGASIPIIGRGRSQAIEMSTTHEDLDDVMAARQAATARIFGRLMEGRGFLPTRWDTPGVIDEDDEIGIV
jgi:phage FluMu gp28-like protein